MTKKKKFIDPKNEKTTTFALIHRSQKDPLAADPDAPQRLLQALPSKEEVKKRKEEERNFGVFYDDEYDYLQHLKSRDEIVYEMDEIVQESKEIDKSSVSSKLPQVVFASKEEEKIGLLNKAAPIRGPLIDWDPDIVETLDDEFKHEQIFTLKDENFDDSDDLDFILEQAKVEGSDEEYEDYDSDQDWDSDEAYDQVPDLESNFSDEETKSKFTQYSMSSSVIRRNAQLTTLDDKFEKFFDDYDEEEIGALEMEELEVGKSEESEQMKQMIREFEKQQAEKRQALDEKIRKEVILNAEDISDDEKQIVIEVSEDENEDKFDCESILTTYSNLYNHPKKICEPSKIRVDGKTGIPKDVLGKGLTMAALKKLDKMNLQVRFHKKVSIHGSYSVHF